MEAQNEQTPLLGERPQSLRSGSSNGSSDTLADLRTRGDEEGLDNDDKANQQVTRWRGCLIILSLWGLIFLQGKYNICSRQKRTEIMTKNGRK
jgi:hypothetical protein